MLTIQQMLASANLYDISGKALVESAKAISVRRDSKLDGLYLQFEILDGLRVQQEDIQNKANDMFKKANKLRRQVKWMQFKARLTWIFRT